MNQTALLQLLQLSDSQVPIGSAAHSFGLETFTAEAWMAVEDMESFLEGYLAEAGLRDAFYCRQAHALLPLEEHEFQAEWLTLNQELSALQPARESRTASATLGRRFLQIAAGLSQNGRLEAALSAAKAAETDVHHATAFGLAGSVLGWTAEESALTYLQQNVMAFVSAGQRLLPLGQTRAAVLLWRLHSRVAETVRAGCNHGAGEESFTSWTPWLDIASMCHPHLATRLFIS